MRQKSTYYQIARRGISSLDLPNSLHSFKFPVSKIQANGPKISRGLRSLWERSLPANIIEVNRKEHRVTESQLLSVFLLHSKYLYENSPYCSPYIPYKFCSKNWCWIK